MFARVECQGSGTLDKSGDLGTETTESEVGLVHHSLRSSRGIACSPLFVASKSVLMFGGTVVRSLGMISPLRSISPSAERGKRSTYCSPIADTLCTSASTSDGILMSESSYITASTPVSVK